MRKNRGWSKELERQGLTSGFDVESIRWIIEEWQRRGEGEVAGLEEEDEERKPVE